MRPANVFIIFNAVFNSDAMAGRPRFRGEIESQPGRLVNPNGRAFHVQPSRFDLSKPPAIGHDDSAQFMNRLLHRTLFAVFLAAIAFSIVAWWRFRSEPAPVNPSSPDQSAAPRSDVRISREQLDQLDAIEKREAEAARSVWAAEIDAQDFGRLVENFWDSINATSNRFDVVARLPLDRIVLGRRTKTGVPGHPIDIWRSIGPGPEYSAAEWRDRVQGWEGDGWRIQRVEFRHVRFDTNSVSMTPRSGIYFSAHLAHSTTAMRAILEGDLVVDWRPGTTDEPVAAAGRIDARGIEIRTGNRPIPFQQWHSESITPPRNAYSVDPLIVRDLDANGLSEILLPGKNRLYRLDTLTGRFRSEPLCRHSPGLISTALVVDVDNDSAADLLCMKHRGLVLFRGSPAGSFDEPERLVWKPSTPLEYPMAMTAGDVDRDGDLDLFIAQYKVPYQAGSIPTPFHDANDGYPSYLLVNEGDGRFSDGTEAAGLAFKRLRRSYSASFVDLDGVEGVDLVVVSDFAGADLYRNNGRGQFEDVTRAWLPDPHAFGMAHALGDWNVDGLLDLLMIGMTSPTADRLNHLNLRRSGAAGDPTLRRRMVGGNRLYLGRAEGGYEFTALSESVARTGWSWGCTTFDFDNDGFPDIYVGNGMESRGSVRDYESEYWLHDAFVGNSREDSAAYLYFSAKFARTRGRGQSYGGHERNRLFLNNGGERFVEAAHLMGVGLENDTRNVVSGDFDGDGLVDLAMLCFETWPNSDHVLRVYRNTRSPAGNWIGFRVEGDGNGPVASGARVTVTVDGKKSTGVVVTGDSYRSQHSNTVHFGLGAATRVDSAEIRWPSGQSLRISTPEINQYHVVRPPADRSGMQD